VLTFVPVLLLKNRRIRYYLRRIDGKYGEADSEEKTLNKEKLEKKLKAGTIAFHVLLSIPTFLLFATILASMERTPLTGRWRMIILSPEEEDEIAAQLAGPGWYKAVGEILQQDNRSVRCIGLNDWRYAWVRDTLRRLEATVPVLAQESQLQGSWLRTEPGDIPLPPPAEYPLAPRPRASERIRHWCCKMVEQKEMPPQPHTIPGPPYSLLIVDKPEASNAFSYGFGPDGGGGVVVYSGFLDEILSRAPQSSTSSESRSSSWLSSFFGLAPPAPSHPIPTEAQTTELAILLAHELSHLILSHHLETLSSSSIFIPGTLSIISDVARVLIFPFTMVFGPFVNDAVAQLGNLGSGELMKIGEYCTSVKQEIEADVVSARQVYSSTYLLSTGLF
jgi:Zn-dependent protease with chaperone function